MKQQEFPQVFSTIDLVVFSYNHDEEELYLVVQKRTNKKEPFYNELALVGGFVFANEDNTLKDAATRIYLDKLYHSLSKPNNLLAGMMSIGKKNIDFLYYKTLINTDSPVLVVGNNTRDPRGWSVSNVFLGYTEYQNLVDNTITQFIKVSDILNGNIKLAFDHNYIVQEIMKNIHEQGKYNDYYAIKLVTELISFGDCFFTIPQLQYAYEKIINLKTNNKTFRRKLEQLDYLNQSIVDIGLKLKSSNSRPASLYSYKFKE